MFKIGKEDIIKTNYNDDIIKDNKASLILFFWYFVTAFCHVYSSTQSSWLLDSFLSILSRFFFEIIFGFLFAKLYRIAVSSNVKTLYKILMCIYDFS